MKLDLKQGKWLIIPGDSFHIQTQQQMAEQFKGKLFKILPFQDMTSNIPFALEIREHVSNGEDKSIVKEDKKEVKVKGKTIQ